MKHDIFRVTSFESLGPHKLRVHFDDGVEREIDFSPVLAGELYSPLQDLEVFKRVELDSEVGTLVWPNGADFDPATLHDWPEVIEDLTERAARWRSAGSGPGAG